jgi:hypothetical protein
LRERALFNFEHADGVGQPRLARADQLLEDGDWQKANIPRQPIRGERAAGETKANDLNS